MDRPAGVRGPKRAKESSNGGVARPRRSSILVVPGAPPLRPYIIAWVPLCAVYVALHMASGTPPLTAMRSALAFVLPFLLLGLLALRVPRLVAWHDRHRAAFFAAQIGLTAVYGATGSAMVIAWRTIDPLLTMERDARFEPISAAWQAVIGGLIYLAIAGGAYAWENARLVREEATRATQADALRARAELAVLRSQLNPHFLLNTLHAALGLVRRDPALAERALERLGEVLHYGLRVHRESLDQIRLAEEWKFVASYLEIEILRLEERLQLRTQADPEAMRTVAPPFVLQPLVENAILHAVAPRRAGGMVTIMARRLGDRVHLEVCDDGPGMPAPCPPPGSGLGLRLLRERLALLYGVNAALSLEAAPGGGLRATVNLPFDPEEGIESA